MTTIPVARHACLDSTSTEAARRLAAGDKAPFAVLASEQTAGRGRRGASWESGAGNLYLTVALPLAPGEGAGVLSLKAAVLIARFLQRETGLRCTLKWPNDVLFNGGKLGGLLLEGHGEALLVGIGLNLSVAPALPGAAYPAVSLSFLTGRNHDPGAVGDALAHYLADEWPRLSSSAVPAAFAEFGIEPGQPWRSEDQSMRRLVGLASDGSLMLAPLVSKGSEVESLSSVDHRYVWAYQGTHAASTPLVVGDLGNSRLKLARFAGARAEEPAEAKAVAWTEEDSVIVAALGKMAIGLPPGWALHTLSVNREQEARLGALVAKVGMTLTPVLKRPVRWRGEYRLTEMGIDRLAAMEGWLAKSARRPAVIVAAGTATTIDVLDFTGAHAGGLILPGLRTALKSLHAATSLLPSLQPIATPPGALGHDTASAMQRAAVTMTTAAIRASAPEGATYVLTGGYASLLAPHLPQAHLCPDLILDGARSMILGGL